MSGSLTLYILSLPKQLFLPMSLLTHLVAVLLILCSNSLDCNSTLGNYLSPHSLGQQDEFNDTLSTICPNIKVSDYTYSVSKTNYTISNVSISCAFFDGKQVATISNKSITISGGKLEFLVQFNFSISRIGPDQLGYAFASVMADASNFTKKFDFGTQYSWFLAENSTTELKLPELKIKRWEPRTFSDQDIFMLIQALDKQQDSVTRQIQAAFNANFTKVLNSTLREQKIFNDTTLYVYPHPTKGDLQIKFRNYPQRMILDEKMGFILEYLTVVEGQSTRDCTSDIPNEPRSYQQYGGIQTVHHFDLYIQTVNYILGRKWADVILDTAWNTNSFQFYAGDLYDIVPRSKDIPPRTRLLGQCQSAPKLSSFSRSSIDKYSVEIDYSCKVGTETEINVLELEVKVKYIIRVGLSYESLKMSIEGAIGVPIFKSVDNFRVENQQLARFKVNQVLDSLRQQTTFGDGFPTWPRDSPNVEVFQNYTLLFDSSHVAQV